MFLFKLTPDGADTFEVRATTRDVLVWEKTAKGRSLTALMNDLRVADMYEIAYTACKRQALWDGNRAEFEEKVDLDFEEEQGAADPTPPAH